MSAIHLSVWQVGSARAMSCCVHFYNVIRTYICIHMIYIFQTSEENKLCWLLLLFGLSYLVAIVTGAYNSHGRQVPNKRSIQQTLKVNTLTQWKRNDTRNWIQFKMDLLLYIFYHTSIWFCLCVARSHTLFVAGLPSAVVRCPKATSGVHCVKKPYLLSLRLLLATNM